MKNSNSIRDKKLYFFIALYFNSLIIVDLVRMLVGESAMIATLIQYLLYLGCLAFVIYDVVRKKLRMDKILFNILSVLIIVTTVSAAINNSAIELYIYYVQFFLTRGLPGIYLISKISSVNDAIIYIKKFQIIWVIYAVLGMIYIPMNAVGGYNMSFGYNMLMPACIVLYSLFLEKRIWYIVTSAVYIFAIIICGSRGPLICLAIYFMFMFLFMRNTFDSCNRKNLKGTLIRAVVILILFIGIILNIENIALSLAKSFPDSRTIKMLASGIFNDAGRNPIYNTFLNELNNHPFAIHGIFADRVFYSQHVINKPIDVFNYPHNIWIEMSYQFGVFIGSLLSLTIIIVSLKGAIKSVKCMSGEVCLFAFTFVSGVIKLLFSSSYLINAETYLYIGVLIYLVRKTYTEKNEGHRLIG